MKRVVFLFAAILIFSLTIAYASSDTDGNNGRTDIYSVNTDLNYGPWLSYYDSWVVQYSRSQLAASVKGFPSKTIGNADLYFMPEAHLTAVVYYNAKGFSTMILLLPDTPMSLPDEPVE